MKTFQISIQKHEMKKYIFSLGVILFLNLVGCSEQREVEEQEDAIYTNRIGGSAEAANGILYVSGGTSLYESLAQVGAYDPTTKTWASKMAIPTPRALGTSIAVGNDIYIIGGRNEKKGVLSSVEKYDSTENTWSSVAPMKVARWSSMSSSTDGMLYVFGGISGTGDDRQALDTIESYDPNNNSWQSVGRMPETRQAAAIAEVGGLIYVISGKIGSYVEGTAGSQITERVDSYDPKTKVWNRVKNIPTGRVSAKAVVVDGLIYVIGGLTDGNKFPKQIDVFDPSSNQWSVGPSLSTGRSGHMCALVGNSIIVFGGSFVSYGSGKPSIIGAMETFPLARKEQELGDS